MSTSPPPTILAAICVVDSSLALAVEWAKIFSDYLTPVNQRLAELTSSANQFRIGFITYGLASSRPSPLLCQRFFQPSPLTNKEMKEEPAKLSLGSTGIGSSSGGMAVLEGIVAALEMFDKLRQSIGVLPGQSQIQHPNKPPVTLVSHILHLAAAPPDGSLHPVWNTNSKFDQLTWATLPDEFKQRQINYSIVTIRPIPRFKEIFLSVKFADATNPWFDVMPNHTIMLSGFPPKGLKRQTEPTTPTPEPKRPRQDSATKPAPDTPPCDLPPPSSGPVTPATNPVAVPTPLSFANMPPAKQQDFMEKYLKLQSEVGRGVAILQKAHADATPQEVILQMKTDLGKKFELYKRFAVLLGPKKPPPSTGAVLAPASQPPPPGAAVPTSKTTPPAESDSSNSLPPALGSIRAPLPSTAATEPQDPNPTLPTMEPHPTETVAPIHRLMQQQNQQSPVHQDATTQPPVVNKPNVIPPPGLPQQWHGMFSSVATNSTQELIMYVSAEFQPHAEPYTATWPQKIHLSPVREGAIKPRVFLHWMNQNNGVLCKFVAQQRPDTPPNNKMLVNQLINYLAEKSIYAVASWPLPNGAGVRKMMAMISASNMLIAAVFPLTGFTEMPKEPPVSQQQVQQPGQHMLQRPVQQMTQPQLSAASIPPELIPGLQMMRAMQARSGATGRGAGPPFTGNVSEFPSSTPQPGTTGPAQQQPQQIPSGINLEMMHAFMRRNQEG